MTEPIEPKIIDQLFLFEENETLLLSDDMGEQLAATRFFKSLLSGEFNVLSLFESPLIFNSSTSRDRSSHSTNHRWCSCSVFS